MAIKLQGAVACVTGGGRGIGRATAEALAERGARVVIGDLDFDFAKQVAAAIGPQALAVRLDVADPVSFAGFTAAAERWGPIDLLVNNAGIMRTGAFAEQSLETQHREIAINLGGVVTGMRLVLPGMLARNRGHIVNVASMAAKMSVPGAAVYTATKFGVASLSRAVRSEISKSRVTITTILPAAVRTELTAGLDIQGVPTNSPEDVAREIVASCRHGRAEVTLPKFLGAIGAIEQALPERLGEFVKRTVGAQKRVSASNERAKAYQERTSR
jgi:NADP-dependent 3-hydroxy acid dehydrogenase YdfG